VHRLIRLYRELGVGYFNKPIMVDLLLEATWNASKPLDAQVLCSNITTASALARYFQLEELRGLVRLFLAHNSYFVLASAKSSWPQRLYSRSFLPQ
jgi:hypothetical protein